MNAQKIKELAERYALAYLSDVRRAEERHDELCFEIDALQAERDALQKELECERMRLAACGVAALGYFNGCADEYKNASLSDVLSLRQQLEALQEKATTAYMDGYECAKDEARDAYAALRLELEAAQKDAEIERLTAITFAPGELSKHGFKAPTPAEFGARITDRMNKKWSAEVEALKAALLQAQRDSLRVFHNENSWTNFADTVAFDAYIKNLDAAIAATKGTTS